MKMKTKKRIEQLIEEILTEIDVEASKIDTIDDFSKGMYLAIKDAGVIVTQIGKKYIKEEEGS